MNRGASWLASTYSPNSTRWTLRCTLGRAAACRVPQFIRHLLTKRHGDTRRPLVLGALHNAVDRPHENMRGQKDGGSFVVYGRQDAEVNLKKQLVIAAKDHMVITIEGGDEAAGDYALEAKDKIDVKAGSTITIEGTGEVTVKSNAGITVDATGPLKLKGATVDIEASATVNVKGSLINIG